MAQPCLAFQIITKKIVTSYIEIILQDLIRMFMLRRDGAKINVNCLLQKLSLNVGIYRDYGFYAYSQSTTLVDKMKDQQG